MKIDVATLFPGIIESYFENSIMKKSIEKELINYTVTDIRDYAEDKHRTCDDTPYGGGAGMVLKAEPVAAALEALGAERSRVVYPTPSGRVFDQNIAYELAQEERLLFICGRYEGLDQRIIEEYVDDEICIGDYVMSSGEVAALVIIDSLYRLVNGVINKESLKEESFSDGLLEYPHYTRPRVFHRKKVPEVLLNGNHAVIDKWRLEKRFEKTIRNRPELLTKMNKEKRQELISSITMKGGK